MFSRGAVDEYICWQFISHWGNYFINEHVLLIYSGAIICNSFEVWASVDFIYKCPIFKRVAVGLDYRKTSYISRTSVGDEIVDNSDVVGASPVGAAPTTSSFST